MTSELLFALLGFPGAQFEVNGDSIALRRDLTGFSRAEQVSSLSLFLFFVDLTALLFNPPLLLG